MVVGKLALGVLRGAQVIFAAIILGLTVALIRNTLTGHIVSDVDNNIYYEGSVPAQTGYNAFAGAWALLFGLIGFVALFLDILTLPMLILDALTVLITVIGGIIFAVAIKGSGGCGNDYYNYFNRIINGGGTVYNTPQGNVVYPNPDANLTSRCHEAQAVTVFLFFVFLVTLGAVVVGAISRKRDPFRG